MVQKRFGNLHAFVEAIRANPTNPQIRPYLLTLDLTEEEIGEVQARFSEFCKVIANADSVSLPEMVVGDSE